MLYCRQTLLRTPTRVNRLSPTLSLYLARQFTVAFLAALGVIVGLIMLFDMIELLRRTVTIDIGLAALIGMALLKMPHTVQETLPFIVLIAMMFALFRLARSHELVVIRSAGVSVWQVLGPPILLVAAVGVLNVVFFNPIAADMYETYQRREDMMLARGATTLNVGEGGLWLREVRGDVASIVHADRLHQDGSVLRLRGNVTIFLTDTHEGLQHRYQAPTGDILDGFIRLDDAVELAPGKTAIDHKELFLPSGITAAKVQDSFASPESMSIWSLPRFIRFSEEAGFSVIPHRLYWQSLLVSPFMLLAMTLLAAVFCLSATTRAMTWTMRGLAGLGVGFLFYFFNRFTYALGLSATLPIVLAAWAPTVITMLLGLGYLFHREDG